MVEEGLENLLLFLTGLFAFATLGNIPEDKHHPDEAAGFVADRRAAVIDVVFGSIAGNQDRVVGEAGYDTVPKHLGYRAFCFQAGTLVDDAKYLVALSSLRLFFAPACEGYGDLDHEDNHSGGIGGDYGIADTLQRGEQPLFAFPDGPGGTDAQTGLLLGFIGSRFALHRLFGTFRLSPAIRTNPS